MSRRASVALVALAVAVAACGGGGAAGTHPAKPGEGVGSGGGAGSAASPAPLPSGATATWEQLHGDIRVVEVAASDAALRTRVQPLFAGEVGKRLERARLRKALSAAMAVPGVAEVTARGVQLGNGIRLVVDVAPQPKIRRVTAQGPGGKPVLLTGVAGAIFGPLDPARLDTEVARLRDSYHARGYLRAEVTWSQVPATQGEVDIVLEIDAGEPVTIGSVTFRGAKGVSAAELGKVVAPMLVAGAPLLADRLERAQLELNAFYWDRGYANIKIYAPDPPDSGRADLVFRLDEGPKFKIGAVKVTGVPDADAARYAKLFGVKTGDVFSRTAIVNGRKRVIDAAVAGGHPGADALPLTKVDLPKQKIDLTLELSLR